MTSTTTATTTTTRLAVLVTVTKLAVTLPSHYRCITVASPLLHRCFTVTLPRRPGQRHQARFEPRLPGQRQRWPPAARGAPAHAVMHGAAPCSGPTLTLALTDSCCLLSARRSYWVVRGFGRAFLYLSIALTQAPLRRRLRGGAGRARARAAARVRRQAVRGVRGGHDVGGERVARERHAQVASCVNVMPTGVRGLRWWPDRLG